MPIKVSFILPCYNVAPYIGRCLESIVHQDIPQEEIEIICVDDCSTDNTIEIIEQYAEKFLNIKLVRHDTNRYSGAARNTGIKHAHGECIWFVDPDDIVCPHVLWRLLKAAEVNTPDILLFNYSESNESGKESVFSQFDDAPIPMIGSAFVKKNCTKRGLSEITSIWRALYKRSFLLEYKICFPEIKSSQDVVFGWHCLLQADFVCSSSIVGYKYIKRGNSVTGSLGVVNPNSVMSRAILFPYELDKMYRSLDRDRQLFDNEVSFVCRDAINRYSRILFDMSKDQKRQFYLLMGKNATVIDAIYPMMNRKTRVLLNYHMPIFIWRAILTIYKIRN